MRMGTMCRESPVNSFQIIEKQQNNFIVTNNKQLILF